MNFEYFGWSRWVWGFLCFGFLICLYLIFTFFTFKPKFLKYKKEFYYGVIWKWKWKNARIIDLKCFCPECESELICRERTNLPKKMSNNEVVFLCNNCKKREKLRVVEADKAYVFMSIQKVISSKIRDNKFSIK